MDVFHFNLKKNWNPAPKTFFFILR
jgi:hypothetical protein